MSLKTLLYAYLLGGITFIPLVILGLIFYTAYTSVPVGESDEKKVSKECSEQPHESEELQNEDLLSTSSASAPSDVNEFPKVRKNWLTVRRTFEQQPSDGSYVGMVRGFWDARSKDSKRSRPKDTWYVVLKGTVLYLYEDESMTECEAAIELGGHDVVIYPEGLLDGELFSKRNAICLKPKIPQPQKEMPSVTKEMKLQEDNLEEKVDEIDGSPKQRQKECEKLVEAEKRLEEARDEALDISTPWFIFVRSVVDMEDWYHALVHASDNPANVPTLTPLQPVFKPTDMSHLVATLDEQPDVIPMRWLNALLGRIFFSYYRTQTLENYIIGRLMKKINKVRRPGFLTDVIVREVSVGNKAPTLSKPMLKELTKEGDAALELHMHYKGEFRIILEATATINLGARFKTYAVKLVLAMVIREMEGNMLVKVKRPPSSRIWYAFTQMPKLVLDIEPVVSDRQITWSMVLSTIQSRVKEVLQESMVLPNMDDISFFDSSQYQHRGGIWADASRHETPSSSYSSLNNIVDDSRSTVSASAAELQKPMPTDPEHPPVQRSQSAEEPEIDAKYLPGSLESAQDARQDMSNSSKSVPSTSPLRRRTWVGSPPESESNVPVPDGRAFEDVGDTVSRGRPSEFESTLTRRSSSTPINVGGGRSDESTPQPDRTQGEGNDYLSPNMARRSSSQHSRSSSSRETSGQTSSDDESSGARSDSQGPKSPSLIGGFGRSSASSSTSTFLQTLKSRAGDKQALSNTAKETMRKWGVNWGGLRKDSGGSRSGDATHEQHQPDPRTYRAKPSYAEVRGHVIQRKEQERESRGENTLSTDLRSDPILIPQTSKGKERARSVSPANLHESGPSTPYSIDAFPSSPLPGPSADTIGSSSHSEGVSPSLPLQRSVSQKSDRSRESTTPEEPVEPEHPLAPIQTQPPQAKTMTIPGIHASHRGEVMSMGYAPPPLPAPSEPKKPAIQSVYRLWKNPNSSSGQALRSTESTPQSQSGVTGDQDAAPPSSDAPTELPLSRPVPPPLPPRTNSALAFHTKPEVAKPAAEADPASSPASAALQSIVSKDRSKRSSLERPASTPASPGPSNDEGENTSSASAPLTSGTPPSSPPVARPKPPALPPRRVPAPV
ncbi:hypothetical protein AcW2_000327 [Taiwanofungus camphoratus]|nr:hypothetical protein AcW2_000327 [Antrodia cinnamomea]